MNFKMSVAVIENTQVLAASEAGVTVEEVSPGENVVTFPAFINVVGGQASFNFVSGRIIVVPGSKTGLTTNQVRILAFTPDDRRQPTPGYTLTVFSPAS